MLPLLLMLSLNTGTLAEDPHKAEPPKADAHKSESAKPTKKKGGVAVPEPAEEKAAEEKPKPKPRLASTLVPAQDQRRLQEAEARSARLAQENARLQQEMAKAQGLSMAEIKTPDQGLAELKHGNERFVAGKRVRTLLALQDPELRVTLSKGQAPFAVIVTCSDSRLMDNFIFDQELGRLFTIREAGNSPDLQGIASAEYAAEHLGSKIVVVLGHTACGAVKAVKEANGKPLPGNLWSLQAGMTGLLESTHEDPNEGADQYLRLLERNNAKRQAQAMVDRSEILRHLMTGGKLKVVPAVYDLASGIVTFFDPVKLGGAPAAGHH